MGHAFFGQLCGAKPDLLGMGETKLTQEVPQVFAGKQARGLRARGHSRDARFLSGGSCSGVMSARLWTTVARTVEEVTHGYPRGEEIKPIVTHDGKTLIEVLEQRLAARDSINQCKEERERIKQQNKRLLVAAAAENRRWQQQYRKPTLSVPTLLELAEVALGEAYVKVCEDLRPEADYCGLAWTPSAIDHNNEPCRITLKRPAVESWTDGDATRKKDSSGK